MNEEQLHHIKQAAYERGFQKQAFTLGSLLGLIYGTAKSPHGQKAEGAIHGGARGLGMEVGGVGGGLLGGLTGMGLSRGKMTAITLAALLGGGLGGYGGLKGVEKLMGPAPWKKKK